jgi:penicillin-binding protein 1A
MLAQHLIDQQAHDAAVAHAPAIAAHVRESWQFAARPVRQGQLIDGLDLPTYALQSHKTLFVNLSLDQQAQQLAYDIIQRRMQPYPGVEAVLIAADGSGAVRALIGSRQYENTDGYTYERQQVGSVYKSFVYLAAMENGAQPDSQCDDVQGTLPISNHGGSYAGAGATLERNFAYSSNVGAVRLAHEVGYERVIALARQLGLSRPPPDVPSWPLAAEATPFEVAQAFLPFSNGGKAARIHFTDAILDQDGHEQSNGPRTLGPQVIPVTALPAMHQLMLGVVEKPGATGQNAKVAGRWIGGKTGTTSNSTDVWFAAYGRDYVIIVWVGRPDNRPLPAAVGSSAFPAQIVGDFLRGQTLGWGDPPLEGSTTEAAAPPPATGVSALLGALIPPAPATYHGPANPPPGQGCDSNAQPPNPVAQALAPLAGLLSGKRP